MTFLWFGWEEDVAAAAALLGFVVKKGREKKKKIGLNDGEKQKDEISKWSAVQKVEPNYDTVSL